MSNFDFAWQGWQLPEPCSSGRTGDDDLHLRTLAAEPVTLPALGHTAHVEDPEAAWSLIAPPR